MISEKRTKDIPDPFPEPQTEKPDTKVEHIVYVDSVGGATVLSSTSLGFKNLDMIYSKLNEKTVKDTILHFRPHLDVKELNICVKDNRI